MNWFGSNDINKGVLMTKLKFGIILKTGLPGFFYQDTLKIDETFKFKREKWKIFIWKTFQV